MKFDSKIHIFSLPATEQNIFDIITESNFKKQAEKELSVDLKNNNVSLDKSKGTISIENSEGNIILYEIKIIQKPR